jgi:hypothetical protein
MRHGDAVTLAQATPRPHRHSSRGDRADSAVTPPTAGLLRLTFANWNQP